MAKKKATLKLKYVEYELEGEDGVLRTYQVRELTGPQLAAYMQSRLQNFVNGDPTKGVKSYAGIFTNLLMYCVYDDQGNAVKVEDMARWPASLQQEMALDAARLSGIAAPEANGEAAGEGNPTTTTAPAGAS